MEDGRRVRAHCPNPGRLTEILVSGTRVILERRRSASRHSSTEYTLVGAYYRGRVVPLYAARANAAVRDLVVPHLFKGVSELEEEVAVGASRIDLRVRTGSTTHVIEVKAVTLVEHDVAMFPDAPSARARRHLDELANATCDQAHVIFAVMQPHARLLVPNLHTDPDFALSMVLHEKSIRYHAVGLRTHPNGTAELVQPSIPVDLRPVRFVTEDCGCYLLEIHVGQSIDIEVGSLGGIRFHEGYYLYVGSAKRGLKARIARHLRKRRKTLRWHIDYLRAHTTKPKAVFLYGTLDEHRLARELEPIADGSVPRFGASDSPESSHLFYFRRRPLEDQSVVHMILAHQHQDSIAADARGVYHKT